MSRADFESLLSERSHNERTVDWNRQRAEWLECVSELYASVKGFLKSVYRLGPAFSNRVEKIYQGRLHRHIRCPDNDDSDGQQRSNTLRSNWSTHCSRVGKSRHDRTKRLGNVSACTRDFNRTGNSRIQFVFGRRSASSSKKAKSPLRRSSDSSKEMEGCCKSALG